MRCIGEPGQKEKERAGTNSYFLLALFSGKCTFRLLSPEQVTCLTPVFFHSEEFRKKEGDIAQTTINSSWTTPTGSCICLPHLSRGIRTGVF